jgi:hypothetical protein
MDHIVTLDSEAKEIENLIMRGKSMIVHASDIKCIPYGIVAEGDVLYFVNDNNPAEIKAKGIVFVYNSYQLSVAESFEACQNQTSSDYLICSIDGWKNTGLID